MKGLLVAMLCCLTMGLSAQTPENRAQDVLDFISGEPGKERDWDVFRSFFTADANFTAVSMDASGKTAVHPFDVEGFISKIGPGYANGFLEEGVKTFSTEFNGIAIVWQHFRAKAGTTSFEGINTLQLVLVEGVWKISSLMWTMASPGQEIPSEVFDRP